MDDDQQWKIPPNVQELAAAGAEEPPSRYMVRDHDRPIAGAGGDVKDTDPVPVVDLGRLSSGAAAEAAKLRSALQTWGLFLARKPAPPSSASSASSCTVLVSSSAYRVAVGHGIEPDLLGEMMAVTREFFNLPLEEKQRYTNLVGGKKEYRIEGYGGDMVLSETQVLDWPHSDGGALTVLLAETAGLQVRRDSDGGGGEWYDVPVVPGALVVNLGDTVEVVSNGVLRSPVHRVVASGERERVSVAAFYTVDPEREVEPAPELVSEERPRRYEKTKKAGDYVRELLESLARGERAIDRVKLV
ncbi:protein SRG1-like [Hordeum vulgare subsp. vulgare]|uniref:protein SRG1-like n=1 Tax=Hordeum vulgare subsp. vulgare TaxID=112509 RepID=UPI001D1A3C4E|nr:protein SRG1-like [Hordeum vulgare subsp. vulgare]